MYSSAAPSLSNACPLLPNGHTVLTQTAHCPLIACATAAVPALLGAERGILINVASVAATDGQNGQAACK